MPLPTDCPSTSPREEFGLALKAARERRGIPLDAIAASTKIPAYIFAGLERGDLQRWPRGLFRRSFFRDYARSIGLPPAEIFEEFVRLFPEDEGRNLATPAAAPAVTRENDLRLVLDSAWHGPRTPVLMRVLAALIDAAAIMLVAAGLARLASIDLLPVMALVSLAYFSLATVLFGESPVNYAMARRASIPGALTGTIRDLFGQADAAAAAEPVDAPAMREWITDAHRVGPSPRLRVRIKVSH
jgi:hypothetical protein